MIDRSPPYPVGSTRVGRTDLGPGMAVVDDNAILIVVHSTPGERSVRVPLSGIDNIAVDGHELALSMRDGVQLRLVMSTASALRDELAVRCRVIPELTRALRAFGSRRGHRGGRTGGAEEQRQFFAPLLDARRRALASTSPGTVSAFDPETIGRSVRGALHSFAVARYGDDAPARRALEAELTDLAEPLHNVLDALGLAAAEVRVDPEDLRRWRNWAAHLRMTFEVADRVWLSLDAALNAAPWGP